jgi:hypothetical protein
MVRTSGLGWNKKTPLKKDKIIGIITTTTNLSNTVKKYFFKHSNFNYR